MAEPKRSGCGCLLPVVAGLVLGPLLFGLLVAPARAGQFRPLFAVFVVVLALALVAALRRSRTSPTMSGPGGRGDGSETSDVPSSPISDDPPIPPGVIAPPPPPTRPARRAVTSAPLEPETALLKERLAEAVADLAEEGTIQPVHRGVTSEEMIARAKKRIREWTDD